MKTSQKDVLDQYLKLSKKPTLRKIADETGIQMTRVFRLLNGSPMRLNEYEIISALILKKKGINRPLVDLLEECSKKFSSDGLFEIEQLLKRKLALWKLKNEMTNLNQCNALN